MGEPVPPEMLSNAIMGKVYDVLTNGDKTVPKSENAFFSWATPGIPVEPDLFEFLTQGLTGVVKTAAVQTITAGGETESEPQKLSESELDKLRAEDTAQLYQNAESFARLVDFVPDVTRMNTDRFAQLAVMNDQGSLSEIYERTLRFSQVAESAVTADEQKKLKRFRSLLTSTVEKEDLLSGEMVKVIEPSPMVKAYHEKMAAYENVALEYNARRIDALSAANSQAVHYWAQNANILRNRVKAAMADWNGSGYKNEFEKIAAYIAQVEGRDLTLLKESYKDDLERAKLTGLNSGSDFYYTALTPGNFYKAKGWTKFFFHKSDFSSYQNSKASSSNWSTQASGGYGLWRAGGGGGASEKRTSYEGGFDASNFSMEFEICQVPIVRPWFKTSYLASKAWRFAEGPDFSKGTVLSDGGSPPKGLLPAYPTSMVFVRNLKLRFGSDSGSSKWVNEEKSSRAGGGVSYGFGPFRFGGASYGRTSNEQSSSQSATHSHSNEGMEAPGMQLIGYKCRVLPKSPNPAPGIKVWV